MVLGPAQKRLELPKRSEEYSGNEKYLQDIFSIRLAEFISLVAS